MAIAGENLADKRKSARKRKGHSEGWPQGTSGCVSLLADGTSTTGTTYEDKYKEQVLKNLKRTAFKLGMELSPTTI